jgi:tetratricopeptide (TPR) repeat protein
MERLERAYGRMRREFIASATRGPAGEAGNEEPSFERFRARLESDLTASRDLSIAFLLEEPAFAQPEERAGIEGLATYALQRPVALILSVNATAGEGSAWEAVLGPRARSERVILPASPLTPEETGTARNSLDGLDEPTLDVVRTVAVLGQPVPLATVAAVMGVSEVETRVRLAPAVERGWVHLSGDVAHVDRPTALLWLIGQVPIRDRGLWHFRIARVLEEFHPHPTTEQRRVSALHLFEADRGEEAFGALVRAALALEHDGRNDDAEQVAACAVHCLPGLPAALRRQDEGPLRIFRARLLLEAGRYSEAEGEFGAYLRADASSLPAPEPLEGLLHSVFPLLLVAGPRPTLVGHLEALVDRLALRGADAAEATVLATLVELELQRGRMEAAASRGHRAGRLAQRLPRGPSQSMAFLAAASPLLAGSPEDRRIAGRLVRAARATLSGHRATDVWMFGELIHARRLYLSGEGPLATVVHLEAIEAAQPRGHAAWELLHSVDLAGVLMDGAPTARSGAVLHRATELAGRLHTSGPSTPWLKLSLLWGRFWKSQGRATLARESWEQVGAMVSPTIPLPNRAEAWLRLAELELDEGRQDVARRYLEALSQPEAMRRLRTDWLPWFKALQSRAEPEAGAPFASGAGADA